MEVDETIELTAKVFKSGVKSSHNITMSAVTSTILQLKQLISEMLDLPLTKYTIVLVYCGRSLQLDSVLSDNNIKNGSCVNVIVGDVQPQDETVVSISEGKQALLRLFSSNYQYMTKTVLTSTNTVNDIACRLPSLHKDLVAQGILKDFNMLAILASPENIDRLLEQHPCIAAAVVHLSRIVIPKADKDSSIYTPPPPRNNRYVLDAMSDDDDDDDEQPAAPTHTITADQLAAAIAVAQGTSTPAAPANSPATATPPAAAAAALPSRAQTDQGTSTQIPSTSSRPHTGPTAAAEQAVPQANYNSQLEQLLAMGIADRALALRALEASGGNVHLALDIIYGGDIYSSFNK